MWFYGFNLYSTASSVNCCNGWFNKRSISKPPGLADYMGYIQTIMDMVRALLCFLWLLSMIFTHIIQGNFTGIKTIVWLAPVAINQPYSAISQPYTLWWRHNEHNGVSNHQRLDCLLNCLFRCRSKKTSKLRVRGIHWWPVNSPHKGPVKRKMFPFDDVIMSAEYG